nr:PREDICTED: beta-1,4-N-acetylgalactosaminyltransferase bre-4-like isoform X2 [Bemisia tabaci]XP_018910602.1 PREDICTED: beta-1,4-N-acetylgalactosaminyltransferase bre-4-like isoform X2 [Bemisia tabaci]
MSTNPVPASGSSAHASTVLIQTTRTNDITNMDDVQFKLEPLIKRNAPSLEVSAQSIINSIRANTLVSLIQRVGNTSCLRHHSPPPPYPPHNATGTKCQLNLPDCPQVPPLFHGRQQVSASGLNVSLSEVVSAVAGPGSGVEEGGAWHPPACHSRHSVAVVIPFRDRLTHLLNLLHRLHPILQRQQLNYRIFVVEQSGNDTFNKGAIMNSAFRIILERFPPATGGRYFHCFVFHDVDMIPEDDRNMYSCPTQPRHLSVAVNEFAYQLPYRVLVGGVFNIRTEHFLKVNGYSNLYWGWGGEDDDMGYRVGQVGLSISRPVDWLGRYTMLKHKKRNTLASKVKQKLVRTSQRRYRLDGLNSISYQLLQVSTTPIYTRILVDVGVPPQDIKLHQRLYELQARISKPSSSQEKT